MRRPKASVTLTALGRSYPSELRIAPGEHGGVVLELHRDDCKGGPVAKMALDEAQAFLRTVQSAVDEAHRRAKLAAKTAVQTFTQEIAP